MADGHDDRQPAVSPEPELEPGAERASDAHEQRRPFERRGWLFSGALLATGPATRAFEWMEAAVTRAIRIVAGRR